MQPRLQPGIRERLNQQAQQRSPKELANQDKRDHETPHTNKCSQCYSDYSLHMYNLTIFRSSSF